MKIGIDIGGSHIGIGIVDEFGQIIQKEEIRILQENKKNIEKFIENFLIQNIKKYMEKYKIDLIGISSAGIIKDGIIIFSWNLGIENYELVKNLRSSLDIQIPIIIENDAKCAAIAENEYGSLKKYNDSIFLTLGTGIGGAIISNNELMKSDDIYCFEFGHILLKENGIECNCGKLGCFERYASIKTFKNILREKLQYTKYVSGKELVNIIRENPNDKIIKDTVSEYIDNLAEGILILINKFEIYNISIGGSFVYFKEIFIEKLENKLQEKTNKKIKIDTAELGNDAGIIGATLLKETAE